MEFKSPALLISYGCAERRRGTKTIESMLIVCDKRALVADKKVLKKLVVEEEEK